MIEGSFWASLINYGYLGVFLASLMGSSIPFVTAPYLVPIAFAVVAGKMDPILTAVLSALGASVGKLVIFVAYKRGRLVLKEETRQRIYPLERLVSRYGWVAVFLAAATPIPDDAVYLPLALVNYRTRYFVPLVFAGKLIITLSASYLFLYSTGLACMIIECDTAASSPLTWIAMASGSAAVAITVAYLVTRLEWHSILNKLGIDV